MYKNLSGETLVLGQELGKGGAAKVFLHAHDASRAIKIFHQDYLKKEPNLAKRLKKLHDISKQIQLTVDYKSSTHTLRKPVGSMPQDLVLDTRNNFVGFVMPTVHNGIDLSHIVFARDQSAFYKYRNKPYYELWFNNFIYGPATLRNRIILCYNLALSFSKLYHIRSMHGSPVSLQLYNFDIKPPNILVSLEKSSGGMHIMPFILDLDNLTLKNETGVLAPDHPQFTPEYHAPEGPIDQYYDYFSLAVIFYQLIMNIHPFEGIKGKTRFTDGTERDFFIRNYCFPWGINGKFLEISSKHTNFNRLPEYIKNLFIEAFDSRDRSMRPNMMLWQKAFLTLLQDSSVKLDRIFNFP